MNIRVHVIFLNYGFSQGISPGVGLLGHKVVLFFVVVVFKESPYCFLYLLLLFSCYVWLFATPLTAACQAPLSWSLLKFMFIESVMLSINYCLILCCPLLLLPSIFPTIKVFSNDLALRIRWPKHWSFSFSISPSHEYSGWISFRIDYFDLLAAQGTLKSFLQHHNLKASILWCSASLSAFFMVQASSPKQGWGPWRGL